MAEKDKKIITNAQYEVQSADLDKQIESEQEKMEASSNFYSSPTKESLVQNIQLRDLQSQREKLANQKLAQDWYGGSGSENASAADESGGVLMRLLNGLSQPLYAEVGAVKYLLGKGEDGFFETVDAARNSRETYGSLLRQFDMPTPVSMPIGFAMDVIMDPVNILTLGSASGAGRVVAGAYKAGLKGAGAGAKATTLRGLYTAARMLPEFGATKRKYEIMRAIEMLGKRGITGLTEESPEVINFVKKTFHPDATWTNRVQNKLYAATKTASDKIGSVKAGLGEKAVQAVDDFQNITGYSVESMLAERAARLSVGDYARAIIEKIPGGAKLLDNFDYNVEKWQQLAHMQDEVLNTLDEFGLSLDDMHAGNITSETRPQMVDRMKKIVRSIEDLNKILPDDVAIVVNKDRPALLKEFERLVEEADDLSKSNTRVTRAATTTEGANRMIGEVATEQRNINVVDAIKEMNQERTQVPIFDKLYSKAYSLKVQNVEVGKKTLDAYAKFIGIFKSSKLGPLSPASMVYATVGNTTMAHMAGFDLLRGALVKRVAQSLSFLRGKTSNEIGRILKENPLIAEYATTFKTTFARSYGFSYEEMLGKHALELLVEEGSKRGIAINSPEFKRAQAKFVGDIKQAIIENTKIRKRLRQTTPLEMMGVIGEEGIQRAPMGDSVQLAAWELNNDAFIQMKRNLAKKAAAGSKIHGLMNWALEQTRKYELADQSYRLGTFVSLIEDGLTEKELRHFTGWTGFGMTIGGKKITPSDIYAKAIEKGERVYKIRPERAALLSNDIYMNYAAMPAAVRVLRQLPILGSPFFAFSYAMALKTGETLATNPSSFNKVNFLMREVERDKSPLEKEALRSKYYSWYNQPGMVGLGSTKFFKDNPIYMNVASMIPYYSMNMFMPSERKFDSGIRGQLASSIDNIPFLKDPIGQLITDYFILPNIIRDTQPQNMWGGPLYPASAPWYQKYIGYPARSLAESVVPSAASIPLAITPEAAIPYIPSYPGRKLANSLRGKTPVGVTGKEDPASRTLRSALSLVGINLYPADLTNLEYQVKKSLKNKK